MFENKTLKRLDEMLDDALDGTFQESDYNETKLSKLEAKWKHFLGASVLSVKNTRQEKENVKQLVSDISHQTKTPMTNIKLYASLLEETIESEENMQKQEESMRLLRAIHGQTEKLEFLIQSLTKMSRLESNILELCPKKQPLSHLLEDTVEEVKEKAEQKRIAVICAYEGNQSACYDLKWTKEALGNILENAVKYSKEGTQVQIFVNAYELYTAVTVKDEGIGIEEDELPKIFGRFYRGSRVQQEDGVGIGLYLAREILRKESGYIKVKSKIGEGTEFQLFLPSSSDGIRSTGFLQNR